jgi:hypothetical protein
MVKYNSIMNLVASLIFIYMVKYNSIMFELIQFQVDIVFIFVCCIETSQIEICTYRRQNQKGHIYYYFLHAYDSDVFITGRCMLNRYLLFLKSCCALSCYSFILLGAIYLEMFEYICC